MSEIILIGWDPITSLQQEYNIDEILENDKKVQLLLSFLDNTDKKLILTFEDSVVFYRRTNESFWLMPDISIVDAQKKIIKDRAVKVINSPVIKELTEESCGDVNTESLIHFLFLDLDTITEVISSTEPKLEWVSNVN